MRSLRTFKDTAFGFYVSPWKDLRFLPANHPHPHWQTLHFGTAETLPSK